MALCRVAIDAAFQWFGVCNIAPGMHSSDASATRIAEQRSPPSAVNVRKRWLRVAAIYHHALEAGVGEHDAIVAAVRGAFSKRVKRSDKWRLMKGRDILRQLENWAPRPKDPRP